MGFHMDTSRGFLPTVESNMETPTKMVGWVTFRFVDSLTSQLPRSCRPFQVCMLTGVEIDHEKNQSWFVSETYWLRIETQNVVHFKKAPWNHLIWVLKGVVAKKNAKSWGWSTKIHLLYAMYTLSLLLLCKCTSSVVLSTLSWLQDSTENSSRDQPLLSNLKQLMLCSISTKLIGGIQCCISTY